MEIQKGFTLKSKDGSEVTFDQALLDHWEMDKEKTGVKNDRLPYLNNAKKTIENPKERWDQEGQRTYLQKFKNDDKSGYCLVTITNDGKVRTYYTTDSARIEKLRKGISHEVFTP